MMILVSVGEVCVPLPFSSTDTLENIKGPYATITTDGNYLAQTGFVSVKNEHVIWLIWDLRLIH